MPTNLDTVFAVSPKVIGSDDDFTWGFDFNDFLNSGELITAVTSIVAAPTGPQFGTPAANATAFTYTDEHGSTVTVPIGRGIQCRIYAATRDVRYELTLKFTTNQRAFCTGRCVLQGQ